jgi:hypothetical protein
VFYKYIRPSKIQNFDKRCNKKLMVLTYCSVAKLSMIILTIALLSFPYYSSDPSVTFIMKSMKNGPNNFLSVNKVSLLNIYLVRFCLLLSLSRNPLPKSN